MNSSQKKLRDYAKLARLQTAPIVVFIPMVGALASGATNVVTLGIIFIIGFLSHIFFFVSNEYVDREIDKHSEGLANKPLIKNSIPEKHAIVIVGVFFIVILFLELFFFPRVLPFFLFIISIAFATLYNIFGKKVVGFEVSLGLWAFTFCIFAGFAVEGRVTLFVYILAVLFLIQMWMACAIDGSIKDADHDYKVGVRTVATALGVRTVDNRLIIPTTYKIFCWTANASYLVIILFFYPLWLIEGQALQLIFVLFFIFIMFYGQYKMISMDKFDRPKILKYVLVHQFPTVIIPLIMLISVVGILITTTLGLFIFGLSFMVVISLYGFSPPAV